MQLDAADVELTQHRLDALLDCRMIRAVARDEFFDNSAERGWRQLRVGNEHGRYCSLNPRSRSVRATLMRSRGSPLQSDARSGHLLPPLLAFGWWKYSAWRAEQDRRRAAAAAARQFVPNQLRLMRTPLVLAPVVGSAPPTALPAPNATVEALRASLGLQASQPKRLDERAEGETRVESLQRAGYLPFPAAPRIQH